jgi:5'-nucleotidase
LANRPLILISNDDGITAPGIAALEDALSSEAEVVVVAPDRERSGTGQAITLSEPLRIKEYKKNWYSISGTPADCILVATKKILDRKPDWIVSGINRGANIGQDTLYSGTVAAAMEGCLSGIKSIAISLVLKKGQVEDYSGCQKVIKHLINDPEIPAILEGALLNVNVPNVRYEDLVSYAVADLGWRIYDERLIERKDPRGGNYYWIGGGGVKSKAIPGSDCELISENKVTLTILQPNHVNHEANAIVEKCSLSSLNKLIGE